MLMPSERRKRGYVASGGLGGGAPQKPEPLGIVLGARTHLVIKEFILQLSSYEFVDTKILHFLLLSSQHSTFYYFINIFITVQI